MLSVVVVNEHTLVRNGLCRLLEEDVGIAVVGETDRGEAVLPMVIRLEPDVVLMDGITAGVDALEATLRLRRQHPSVGVVVVTRHGHGQYPRRFLAAGAHGYLDKDCQPVELQLAVRLAAGGERYISQRVAQEMALARGGPGDDFDDLTPAEFRILLRITSGHSTDETAAALFMSPKTVATYRSRIFGKLGVRGPVEATHLALREGLISIGATARPLQARDVAASRRGLPPRKRSSRSADARIDAAHARGPESRDVDGSNPIGS